MGSSSKNISGWGIFLYPTAPEVYPSTRAKLSCLRLSGMLRRSYFIACLTINCPVFLFWLQKTKQNKKADNTSMAYQKPSVKIWNSPVIVLVVNSLSHLHTVSHPHLPRVLLRNTPTTQFPTWSKVSFCMVWFFISFTSLKDISKLISSWNKTTHLPIRKEKYHMHVWVSMFKFLNLWTHTLRLLWRKKLTIGNFPSNTQETHH